MTTEPETIPGLLRAIIGGSRSLAELNHTWPGYPVRTAAAFEARVRRAQLRQPRMLQAQHYLQPRTREELRHDETYLIVQTGASFSAAKIVPGREAARALATKRVAVYTISPS